jgi:hypothetical protein
MVGLTAILREAWTTSYQTQDRREKIQALSLAKECYSMKLELLTNATVLDDAIRFVYQKSKDKEKLRSCSSSKYNKDEKELKEPDYDEDDEEQLEQEKQIREITTNQVFEITLGPPGLTTHNNP